MCIRDRFEHAFNDRVTIHQSLRYSHSDADYRSIYTLSLIHI